MFRRVNDIEVVQQFRKFVVIRVETDVCFNPITEDSVPRVKRCGVGLLAKSENSTYVFGGM